MTRDTFRCETDACRPWSHRPRTGDPCGLRDYGTAAWEGGEAVLDPFVGSGTVLRVARRLRREGVGVELNPSYLNLARGRATDVQTEMF